MAYDYSSSNARLDLPNPYAVQNRLLFISAGVLLLGGLVALVQARTALALGTLNGWIDLMVGIVLVGASAGFASVAALRLRFFFGRGRPAPLAPDSRAVSSTVPPAYSAEKLKSMLRQAGIAYPEPSGALNGVLYHQVPHLITAPAVVQTLAQRHFFNSVAVLVTLLSYLFATVVLGSTTTQPLISALYCLFTAALLVRPMIAGGVARVDTRSLVALVVGAVVGPVLLAAIARTLPALPFSLQGPSWLLLVGALVAAALIFMSVTSQIEDAPQTERSSVTVSLSMNGPPAALVTELDRRLQDQWEQQIPNRRYTHRLPSTSDTTQSGQFSGEVMEETQPMPLDAMAAPTVSAALQSKRNRYLVLLDLYATALAVVGVGFALNFCLGFDAQALLSGHWGQVVIPGYSTICLLLAGFCFQSSGSLWGRFDFASTLVWVEMQGQWQSSRIGTGNQLTSRMHTDSQVVRVEAMTLRVWRARLESVVFGKDGARQVTAMYATQREAEQLANDLSAFAGNQSVLIAPGGGEDARRLATLQQCEAVLNLGTAADLANLVSGIRGVSGNDAVLP